MNNVNEANTKASIKEIYSILSQAAISASTNNSGSLSGLCSANYDNVCFKDYMKQYLKYTKDCGGTVGSANSTNAPITNGCWITTKTYIGGTDNEYNNYAGLILVNGMMAVFRAHHPDCVTTEDNCGWVAIDINGAKSPNTMGKDTFVFSFFQNGKVSPSGDAYSVASLGPCGSETPVVYAGWNCTYKYIFDN